MTQNLQVTVASQDALDVRQFSVIERMSSLFEITLLVLAENPDIDFESVIGQEATFTITGGFDFMTTPRVWTGVCTEAQQVRVEESGASTYHVVLHPWLWLTTQRRNHRMFQQKSELDIVLAVLSDWGIEAEQRLTGTYKKRKYKIQYGESDFAFISRMLEEAGITFFFETVDGKSKLVLCDAPEKADARAPIAFRDTPSRADREHATEMRVSRRVRPGKYTMRDHDYRKDPQYKLLAAGAAPGATAIEQKLERYHYTPGAFLFGGDKGEATPSADDKGKSRTDEGEAAILAQKRLDAKRSAAHTLTFETNVVDVAPGVVTTFLDHPRGDLGPGKRWLIVEVTRHGTENGEWSTTCEARTADASYRPALVTPKPRVLGVESATVVGPAGEEIHTDEFGRVRVHFHWDRESQMNDDSSCWIHVSQPWGGSGYGGSSLPRIGQEVIVDFLGGDPDRPIITGRVYTNLQKTPYALPANKTQSGWKSNSTGGTGGFNEMMFEDAAGKELFRIQAERDLSALVKHDADVIVGRDATTTIKRNAALTVDKDLSKNVLANEREVTGQNRAISVGANLTTHVGGNDTLVVTGNLTTMVNGSISTKVPPPGAPPGGGGPGTTVTVSNDKIVLATKSGATVTLSGPDISLSGSKVSISATQKLTLSGKTGVDMSSAGGPVTITGGPMVLINPTGALFSGRVTDPSPAAILRGAATVLVGGPQFPYDVVRLPNGDLQVGKAITIHGDAKFQGAIMSNLGKMSTTPAGQHVLDVIDNSGHTMTIIPYGKDNSFCGPNPTWADMQGQSPAGQPIFDGEGHPVMGPDGTTQLLGTGTGANTTLQMNPDLTLPNSQDPNNPMPNDAIQFHEMTHGTHQMTGTADMSPNPGWDTNEERNTISTGSPSEADYLQQTGYPYHRTDHDLTWAPN